MGLIKTAAKVAVASSVHGRVQRRQQARWATQDSSPPQAPVLAQAPVSALDANSLMLAQLSQLGELKAAGVLTDAEFDAKKAVILAQ